MEAEVINDYAKKNPKRKFLDCTEGGLKLSGIQSLSLGKAIEQYCTKKHNLQHMISKHIDKLSFRDISNEKIENLFAELTKSLLTCQNICRSYLEEAQKNGEETGKMLFLEHEIEEEIAYHCFLQVGALWTNHLFPKQPLVKWQQMEKSIGKILKNLDMR